MQEKMRHSGKSERFRKAFNKNEFDSTLSFTFKVDWEQETKGYSEELETVYYEYLIEPENVNGGETGIKQGRQNKTIYKLIAVEKSGQPEFYVLKLYGSGDENKNDVSWAALENFSGLLILVDRQGNEVLIKDIAEGKSIGEGKAISAKKGELIKNGRMKMALGCYTVSIEHGINWFQWINNEWVFLDYQYVSTSYYEVCSGTGGGPGAPAGDVGGGAAGRNPANHHPRLPGYGTWMLL